MRSLGAALTGRRIRDALAKVNWYSGQVPFADSRAQVVIGITFGCVWGRLPHSPIAHGSVLGHRSLDKPVPKVVCFAFVALATLLVALVGCVALQALVNLEAYPMLFAAQDVPVKSVADTLPHARLSWNFRQKSGSTIPSVLQELISAVVWWVSEGILRWVSKRVSCCAIA